jgi:DNA-binding IclR family transcriptional regulator
MTDADETHSPHGVIERVLAVLAAFEGTTGSLTVAGIAQRADLPVSTTYRIVATLEGWGGLRKGSDGRYQIGFRLWSLGQQAGRRLRDRAHPYLQDLFDLTQENVHLAIRDGLHSLYVDKVYNSRKLPIVSRVGGRLPLHATAVGRVLLAAQPDWFVQAYLSRELESPTPSTVTDPVQLAQVIENVRREGLSVTYEQMRLGAISLAAPIVYEEETVAAVAVVFDVSQAHELDRLRPAVKGTADKISRAMRGGSAGATLRRVPPPESGPFLKR